MIDLLMALRERAGGWIQHAVETIGFLIIEGIASLLGIQGLGVGLTIFGLEVSASVVGSLALAAIFLGVSLALRPSLPSPADGIQATKQDIPPRAFMMGCSRYGGVYMLYESSEDSSHDVTALNDGKIGGFRKFFLHDDEVGIDPVTGFVTSTPGHTDDRYLLHVFIRKRYGEPTETAYTEATTKLPTIWTVDHRGDGTASLYLECIESSQEGFQIAYPNALPAPSAVYDGPAIWDPRDVAQDPDDPATWVDYPVWDDGTTYVAGDRVLYSPDPDGPGAVYISRGAANLNFDPVTRPDKWISVNQNPVLQIIYFLTSTKHGLGLDRAVLITPVLAALMAEADICDELVQLKSLDYEPRYVSNGYFLLETDPSEIINAILVTCDGWMTEDGEGSLVLIVGKYRAPGVLVLKPRHIVGMKPSYGIEDEKIVNDLQIKFTSPAHKYKEAPGQAWRDEADIAERGMRRSRTLSVPWVHYHPQARRLAKRQMARLNAIPYGTLVARSYGLAFLGKRWIRLQFDLDGLEDCIIEIKKASVDLMAGRVTFDWHIVNPNSIDAWDPDTEEGTPPPVVDNAPDAELPVPDEVEIALAGDESTGLMAQISFADPLRPALSYVMRFRLEDDPLDPGNPGPWAEQSISEFTTDGDRITVSTTVLPIDQNFVFQVASVGTKGTRSDWSEAITFSVSTATITDNDGFQTTDNSGVFIDENA